MRFILPTVIITAGIFLTGETAFAISLPGEAIVGDYTLKISAFDKTYEFSYPEIDTYNGSLYLKGASDIVRGIYLDTLVKPINAEVGIYPERDNPFEYASEKLGKGIDEKKLLEDIETALYARKRQIIAKTVEIYPEVYERELIENTRLLSSFSTDCSSSSSERKYNIRLAVKAVGGRELKPKEEFSFNEVVGERTKERGYKEAKIIEGGKFVDGVGGGVCQVSSTLYNSALLAGLAVTERNSHSLAVSYVEPSFDAMVNSGSSDLKFVNGGKNSVYIVGSCDGERITFRIYGKNDGYKYERSSKVVKRIKPKEEEVLSSDLPEGERRVAVTAKEGIKSEGYLEKYLDGKLIERKKLSEDYYAPLDGKIEVGAKE